MSLMSWIQVVQQIKPKQAALDGLPRGLDKKGWLDILYKRKNKQSDFAVLQPRYPFTAVPADPSTFSNYVGGGLDPEWKEPSANN